LTGFEPLDPQIAALIAGPEGALTTACDPATLRAEHAAGTRELAGPPEPVDAVRDVGAPVPARIYEPAGAHGTIVYLHGGGWVVGSPDTYDQVGRILANAAGARVVLVDYRLAPEHPFPAALEDAEASLTAVLADDGPVAVAGDSAGGQLAAVLARRHAGRLAAQLLVYPVLDTGMATASYERFATGFRLTAADMAWFVEQYGGDPDDPDVSPLRAPDLAGLPPATIVVASHDVLRDEGEAYARRLREAGVAAELIVWPGTVHGFIRWPAKVDAARAALVRLGEAAQAAFRPGSASKAQTSASA